MKTLFFYDESEHSRKINESTVTAMNFASNFVVAIIGYNEDEQQKVISNYKTFEEKFIKKFTVSELKSTLINPKHLKYGFASLIADNLDFIEEYLNFFEENNILIYFSVINKVEYIVNQLFSEYTNSLFYDMDSLKYSIAKLIVEYHPDELINAVYNEDINFIEELKLFIKNRIKLNEGLPHKTIETEALTQALIVLSDYNNDINLKWNYQISLEGFKKYLAERNIQDYQLIIDKEGKGDTLAAAQNVGMTNVYENDSKDFEGIRIADILAGIISKFIKSIEVSLNYNTDEEVKTRKVLSENWFKIDERKLKIYKILKSIIINQNDAWYKSYSSRYADHLIYFICLLNYISSYKNLEDFNRISLKQHSENVSYNACKSLQDYFKKLHSKLPIEPIPQGSKEFYYNQKGAKCYFDYKKHKTLDIPMISNLADRGIVYKVLSAGFFGFMEQPCVTIEEMGEAVCYLLPKDLIAWVASLVKLANLGQKFLPCNIEFGNKNGRYYAEMF